MADLLFHKAYKVRLYPTEKQKAQIDTTIHCCRFLYNRMLAERIKVYEELKDNKEALYAHKYRSPADYKKEFPFLREASSWALNNETRFLQAAYRGFFRRNKLVGIPSGFPKYKSRKKDRWSYTDYSSMNIPRIKCSKLTLNKLPGVKFRGLSSSFRGKIKSVTVVKERDGRYYASILTEFDAPDKKVRACDGVVGVDLGLKEFATLSTGEQIGGIKYPMQALDKKIRKQQRHLSRKMKCSHRREKCGTKLNRLWRQRQNFLSNFQWALANRLCAENQTIVVEDLNVQGMKRNRRLSHAIHNINWASFVQKLTQKAVEYGTEVVRADRFFPSSKMCSRCGAIKPGLKLSDRTFRCDCGHIQDRDVNAAINLRNYSLNRVSSKNGEYSRGEAVRPIPVVYDGMGGFCEAITAIGG